MRAPHDVATQYTRPAFVRSLSTQNQKVGKHAALIGTMFTESQFVNDRREGHGGPADRPGRGAAGLADQIWHHPPVIYLGAAANRECGTVRFGSVAIDPIDKKLDAAGCERLRDPANLPAAT